MPKIGKEYALVKVELLDIYRDRTFYYQVKKDSPNLKIGAICEIVFRGIKTRAKSDEIINDPSIIENDPWTIKTITDFLPEKKESAPK